MIKKIIRFFMVCVFAAIMGLVLYTQTDFGKQFVDDTISRPNTTSSVVTDNQDFSGTDTDDQIDQAVKNFLDDVGTGSSGQEVSSAAFASGVIDNSLLQKRLEYYKSHKKELGM